MQSIEYIPAICRVHDRKGYQKHLFRISVQDHHTQQLTMSSGLAFGFGNPASCMSSKANATLTTFSSKD